MKLLKTGKLFLWSSKSPGTKHLLAGMRFRKLPPHQPYTEWVVFDFQRLIIIILRQILGKIHRHCSVTRHLRKRWRLEERYSNNKRFCFGKNFCYRPSTSFVSSCWIIEGRREWNYYFRALYCTGICKVFKKSNLGSWYLY